jgi:hypothetical protein
MEAIKKFMQDYYTDERLAELLAHAQDGKLAYVSCCCFIGVCTANHPLQDHQAGYSVLANGEYESNPNYNHLQVARQLPGAGEAEREFQMLGWGRGNSDEQRRAQLIPLILEEMERREKLRGSVVREIELALVY